MGPKDHHLAPTSIITLDVKVTPRARQQGVVAQEGTFLKVKVFAPPEDGKANAAVTEVLAEHLGVKSSQLVLVRGHTNTRKVFTLRLAENETCPPSLLPPLRLEDF